MADSDLVFRDYAVDGVPSSGAHRPVKSEVRELFNDLKNWVVLTVDAVGDSTGVGVGTDDTAAIQAVLDAAIASSTSPSMTYGGTGTTIGGARVRFPPRAGGYRIASGLIIENNKITLEGPAVIYVDAGVTAITLANSGENPAASMVEFSKLDIIGGAGGIDVGTNVNGEKAVLAEKCKFINQTTFGFKTGTSSSTGAITDCQFSGCAIGLHHRGSSADAWSFQRNLFIYNKKHIVVENGCNTWLIENNNFVGNLEGDPDITIDTTTAQTGSNSIIRGNKFGPESRTLSGGSPAPMILLTGGNPIYGLKIIDNPMMAYPSTDPGGVVKVVDTPLFAFKFTGNYIEYGWDFDAASTFSNTAAHAQNEVRNTHFPYTRSPQLIRGNAVIVPNIEPREKINLLNYSRWENDANDFTLSNATPSYLTAADEAGTASNASTFTATSASNTIDSTLLETNSTQAFYTFTQWLKLGSAAFVSVQIVRASNFVISQQIWVGTDYQRLCVEFYQLYLAAGNPYTFRLIIPNGAVVTLGSQCLVAGRDAGDLVAYKAQTVKQIGPKLFRATAIPTAGRFAVGDFVYNTAPALDGNNMTLIGWSRLVAGTAHVSGTDWAFSYGSHVSPAT